MNETEDFRLRDFPSLALVTLMILVAVVLILAPMDLLRQQTKGWWEVVVGIIGLAFWGFVAWFYAIHLFV